MKKTILALFVLMMTLSASAQKSIRITEASVVKDSSGQTLTPAIWRALLASGKYGLRPETPGQTDGPFILRRLSEEEVKRIAGNAPRPRESQFFTTGKKVPGFTARDLKGNKYKLKELEGKVVVLNFWFINCGPCRMEMPELNKLADDYKDSSNIVFLAVALDAESDVESFLAKSPFHYNVISDGRYIASIYKITSYPTHAVIDKTGKILFHTSGYGASTIPWLRKSIVQAMGED